jgi:hypothetical protein
MNRKNVEEENVEVDENVEDASSRQNPITQPQIRICRSCGSSANLFKTKKHLTCIECCNLRPGKTEKQLESFKKAREKRQESILRRKQEIQEFENKAREELDNKIVSKAISIKKKMIKKNAELDEISDDDTPLEEVMKISKKSKPVQKKVSISESDVKPPQRQRQQTQSTQQPTQQPTQQTYQPQIRAFNFL